VTASPGGELKTRYTSVSGTKPLRDKIAEYLTNSKQTPCTSDQILVSNGGKQSLVQAILAFTGPGDEVIVPAPYWVSYTEQCTLAGSTPVVIRTDPEAGFLLDPEVLDTKINSHTRMLILCNPS
jgi:aspartate/glutamate/aspartate-prephenate aminotransferase